MMTDEELRNQYRSSAADEAQRLRIGADNLAERLAELDAAGLRAVYNAGLAKAAQIVREHGEKATADQMRLRDERQYRLSDMEFGKSVAAEHIAAAIEAEKGQK